MECDLCHLASDGLINLRLYTSEGIRVCSSCYNLVQQNRYKPYSQVMDRVAVAEAGYYANRKHSKLNRG